MNASADSRFIASSVSRLMARNTLLPFLLPSRVSIGAQLVNMATELTVKERAFARLIIEGTKSSAYRAVYSSKGTPATQAVNACKLSKRPKVKAEVARLLRQRECPADDYARIRDMAVAGLTEMFISEPDPRVRAKVGSILLAYADEGLKLHPVPTEKERKYDELANFLRNMVRPREGPAGREEEHLIVEPVQTDEEDAEAATSKEEEFDAPTVEYSEMGIPLSAEAVAEESLETWDLAPIPGCFPPKYRRVERLG